MSIKKAAVYAACCIALCGVLVGSAAVQSASDDKFFVSREEVLQAYRQQKEIGVISSIRVPTIVEVPLDNENFERWEFAVYDVTADLFEPNMYHAEAVRDPVRFFVSKLESSGSVRFPEQMVDGDTTSYTDILLPDQGMGLVTFTITTSRPITSSGITLLLGEHVALPTGMEIRALVDGDMRVVSREERMLENTVWFPGVTALQWIITFSYVQPLRIAEFQILDDDAPALKRGVRFLAQPGRAYQLYFDPDRFVQPSTSQAANFTLDEGVIRLSSSPSEENFFYRPADVDEDSIPDMVDNCVATANYDQEDMDDNGRGDACDDFDRDGLVNSEDNCPDNPNRDQRDTDGDAMGDACDQEESRFTEQYPWIPWVGMGIAGAVLIVLLVLTARSMPQKGA